MDFAASVKVGLSCIVLALSAAPKGIAASCTLPSVAWIAGVWRNVPPADPGEERWVLEPDGVLMGSSWTFPQKGAGFAEVMTISADADQVVMRLRHFDRGIKNAWEEKGGPMVFALTACEEHSAVFSGLESHAGERLTYTRSDKRLTIVGDFIHNGNPLRLEFHLERFAD